MGTIYYAYDGLKTYCYDFVRTWSRHELQVVLTLKYGYHIGLMQILVGVCPISVLITSSLSSAVAYKTYLKYLEIVSLDLLNVLRITLNL